MIDVTELDLEAFAFHRDMSLSWVGSRGPATFHAAKIDSRSLVARCNGSLILVEDAGWRAATVPATLRCRRPACRALFTPPAPRAS